MGPSVLVRPSETASCPRTLHIRRDYRPAAWYLRWEHHQAAQGASTFVAQRTNCQPAILVRRADGSICLAGFSISEKRADRYVRWQGHQYYDTPPEHAPSHASVHSSSVLLSSVGSDLQSKYIYTHRLRQRYLARAGCSEHDGHSVCQTWIYLAERNVSAISRRPRECGGRRWIRTEASDVWKLKKRRTVIKQSCIVSGRTVLRLMRPPATLGAYGYQR